MEDGLAEAIDEGKIGPRDDPKARSKILADEYGWDKDLAKKIWCVALPLSLDSKHCTYASTCMQHAVMLSRCEALLIPQLSKSFCWVVAYPAHLLKFLRLSFRGYLALLRFDFS